MMDGEACSMCCPKLILFIFSYEVTNFSEVRIALHNLPQALPLFVIGKKKFVSFGIIKLVYRSSTLVFRHP